MSLFVPIPFLLFEQQLTKDRPVAALDSSRFGLNPSSTYPLTGILHLAPSQGSPSSPLSSDATPARVDVDVGSDTIVPLEEITRHLMGTYVDKIGYEFEHSPEKDERLYVNLPCIPRTISSPPLCSKLIPRHDFLSTKQTSLTDSYMEDGSLTFSKRRHPPSQLHSTTSVKDEHGNF